MSHYGSALAERLHGKSVLKLAFLFFFIPLHGFDYGECPSLVLSMHAMVFVCLAENVVLKWGGLSMAGFVTHVRLVVSFGLCMNLHGSGLSCMDLQDACSLVCLSLVCMKFFLALFNS